jgi:hypothetical protein
MRHIYTNLGAVPAIAQPAAERQDALLARTGPAARRIMRHIKRLPRSKQVAALDRVLERFDSELPARVRRVAEHLHRGGMPTDRAVERALALSLADASIEKIKRVGYAYRRGEGAPYGPAMGLGTSGTGSSSERSAEDEVAAVFQGIACSNGLQATITDLVGRNEGADAAAATNTGYEVLQGAAQCGTLTPTPPPPPAPPTTTQSSSGSLAVPLAIGAGALLLVGGAVWYTTKKK